MDSSAESRSEPENSAAWWSARRRRYNVGLVVAGIGAFIAYVVVITVFSYAIPGAEITNFTTVFQGLGYLVCMAIAHVFYQLGPMSERWLHPADSDAYRRATFAFGFWLSVALPFSIPALLAGVAILDPQYFQ
jgi:hypothetical protein